MKNRTIACMLALMMTAGIAGCSGAAAGNSGTAAETTDTSASAETAVAAEKKEYPDEAYLDHINASDYVTVADYSKIPVEAAKREITGEEIREQIDSWLQSNQKLEEVTDRKDVQDGDVVNIDYEGKKDGVAFDGGTAKGFDLTIGSNRFIKGFETGLIGKNAGDTTELNLTFPKESTNEDLAGKDVVFTVTINKIQKRVTPELTDDFVKEQAVQDLNGKAVETVDRLQSFVREYLEQSVQKQFDTEVQGKAMQYLLDNSQFAEKLPEAMQNRTVDMLTNIYTSYAQSYGTDLKTFMTSFGGASEDDYEQQIRNSAEEYLKQLLVVKAIADKENLSVSDEEFNTQLGQIAAASGMTAQDYMEKTDIKTVREEMLGDKVLTFLLDKADITAPADDASAAATAN